MGLYTFTFGLIGGIIPGSNKNVPHDIVVSEYIHMYILVYDPLANQFVNLEFPLNTKYIEIPLHVMKCPNFIYILYTLYKLVSYQIDSHLGKATLRLKAPSIPSTRKMGFPMPHLKKSSCFVPLSSADGPSVGGFHALLGQVWWNNNNNNSNNNKNYNRRHNLVHTSTTIRKKEKKTRAME